MKDSTSKDTQIRSRYRRALVGYAADPEDEIHLMAGQDLGRTMLEEGHGLIDLLAIHYKLAPTVAAHSAKNLRKAKRANDFLTQVAAPFEMAYRGWREMAHSLQSTNEALELRVAERTAAHREAEARLSRAQRVAGVGSWEMDVVTRVQVWSDQMYRICGLQPGAKLAKTDAIDAYVDDADRLLHQNWLAALEDGRNPGNIEYQLRCSDGQLRIVSAEGELISIAGRETKRVICTVQDITERKELDHRFKEMQEELAHMSRQSVMGQMGSALSHELNQPLTAAKNYLGAARRRLAPAMGADAELTAQIIDKALQQVTRTGEIIRKMRVFVAKGRTEHKQELLHDVVQEACSLALAGRSEHEVMVEFELDPSVREAIIDRVQIQQVLVNLIRNAMEAMVGQERRELTIATVHDQPGMIRVSVVDTGPGLPAKVASRLFTPFVTTKTSGLGIGLSISRSIVESHGGKIWAEPAPWGGTAFHFTVPEYI